jgi:hypothetical protein
LFTCYFHFCTQAFHVFHTSCIIHWLLLCEFEIITKELVSPKLKRRKSKRKNAAKYSEIGKEGEVKATRGQIDSVFCPECQGTGIIIEGDELEKPSVPLSEVCTLWDIFYNYCSYSRFHLSYMLVSIFYSGHVHASEIITQKA